MGLESYAFREISSSIVPDIVHFARFLALFYTVNSAIFGQIHKILRHSNTTWQINV